MNGSNPNWPVDHVKLKVLASAKQSGARRAKRAVVEAAGRQRSEGGRGRSEVLFIPTNAGN